MEPHLSNDQKLIMSFDPQTIEHLGVKMYSQLPNAIAELIANSYDAESPEVHIILTDTDQEKSIAVVDTGIGMSFSEINDNFLRIGRKRRDLDNGLSCLIAEPISGTSFIKVSYYDEEINEENIGELSKQLLQMDIKEIHDNPKTLHAKHTTFETFKNLILSCLGEDRTLNYYTKSNIVRSISGLKKEDK